MNEKAQEQVIEEDAATDQLDLIFSIYLGRIKSVFEAMDCVREGEMPDHMKLRLLEEIIYLGIFVTDRIGKDINKLMDLPYDKTGKTMGEIEVELAGHPTGLPLGDPLTIKL